MERSKYGGKWSFLLFKSPSAPQAFPTQIVPALPFLPVVPAGLSSVRCLTPLTLVLLVCWMQWISATQPSISCHTWISLFVCFGLWRVWVIVIAGRTRMMPRRYSIIFASIGVVLHLVVYVLFGTRSIKERGKSDTKAHLGVEKRFEYDLLD